jgi:bacterial/archaeal transporter family-2 protein
MKLWLWMIAALAGMLNPVQSGANGQLGKAMGNPYAPVLISLSISMVFAFAVSMIVQGGDVLNASRFRDVPWWAWIGGFCGAVFLFSQPVAAPRLGAAVYIGITVTASVIASVALDHFGLLGFPLHPANIGRLIGAALMIVGVSLIAMF